MYTAGDCQVNFQKPFRQNSPADPSLVSKVKCGLCQNATAMAPGLPDKHLF